MSWVYAQKSGTLRSPEHIIYKNVGYSGHGLGRNNPQLQDVRNTGPLPQGLYTIGTAYKHPMLGPIAMSLTPDPTNTMFGRSHFYIHGDNRTNDASLGCIILPPNLRTQINLSKDKTLIVIEDFKPVEDIKVNVGTDIRS